MGVLGVHLTPPNRRRLMEVLPPPPRVWLHRSPMLWFYTPPPFMAPPSPGASWSTFFWLWPNFPSTRLGSKPWLGGIQATMWLFSCYSRAHVSRHNFTWKDPQAFWTCLRGSGHSLVCSVCCPLPRTLVIKLWPSLHCWFFHLLSPIIYVSSGFPNCGRLIVFSLGLGPPPFA